MQIKYKEKIMRRKMIRIDEDKCNGCGACAGACHEGAIEIINGKARLTHEDYCDGLGDCLPVCPTGAILIEEREAAAYNEEAARRAKAEKIGVDPVCGCPGIHPKTMKSGLCKAPDEQGRAPSRLMQWPCQIKLVPTNAPYFENASLLIAADCAAYAYGDFHSDFMKNHITLIGCPKFDGDYAEKLTQIIKHNNIKRLKVVRMEVPCCGGLEIAVKRALMASGKIIPWKVVTVSTDGRIIQ